MELKNRCDYCGIGRAHPEVLEHYFHRDGELCVCPNCRCLYLQMKKERLSFMEENKEYVDELTGKKGAIKYYSDGEEYCLNKKAFFRLLAHNLTSKQWEKLSKNREGKFSFMIHDDYYDEDGKSIQPVK